MTFLIFCIMQILFTYLLTEKWDQCFYITPLRDVGTIILEMKIVIVSCGNKCAVQIISSKTVMVCINEDRFTKTSSMILCTLHHEQLDRQTLPSLPQHRDHSQNMFPGLPAAPCWNFFIIFCNPATPPAQQTQQQARVESELVCHKQLYLPTQKCTTIMGLYCFFLFLS